MSLLPRTTLHSDSEQSATYIQVCTMSKVCRLSKQNESLLALQRQKSHVGICKIPT
jgi:hypothetical protein